MEQRTITALGPAPSACDVHTTPTPSPSLLPSPTSPSQSPSSPPSTPRRHRRHHHRRRRSKGGASSSSATSPSAESLGPLGAEMLIWGVGGGAGAGAGAGATTTTTTTGGRGLGGRKEGEQCNASSAPATQPQLASTRRPSSSSSFSSFTPTSLPPPPSLFIGYRSPPTLRMYPVHPHSPPSTMGCTTPPSQVRAKGDMTPGFPASPASSTSSSSSFRTTTTAITSFSSSNNNNNNNNNTTTTTTTPDVYRQRAVNEKRLVEDFESLLPKYLVFLEDGHESDTMSDMSDMSSIDSGRSSQCSSDMSELALNVDDVVSNFLNTIHVADALHKTASTSGFFEGQRRQRW